MSSPEMQGCKVSRRSCEAIKGNSRPVQANSRRARGFGGVGAGKEQGNVGARTRRSGDVSDEVRAAGWAWKSAK